MKRKKAKPKARRQVAEQTARPEPGPEDQLRTCDDYLDDPTSPQPLRKYLEFARAPAHGQLLPRPHPRLFADHAGRRVRVTMASRLGDVGVTTDFSAEMGYEQRVWLDQLSNFSEDP